MFKVLLEESIMQIDTPASAGSKMLESFIAPFDATVVTLLKSAGVQPLGRLSFSEFGTGGLFSDQNDTLTSAVNFFADSSFDAVLCNDYTGAISAAAGTQGLYYIHPTYGTVSRYGLVPSVCSMDQIGVLCRDIKTGFKILDIIKCVRGQAFSPVPMTQSSPPVPFHQPYYDIYPQIMHILCSAELSANLSRYDGIKFGYRAKDYNNLNELYTKSRTQTFGEDTKLAMLIGAVVLSKDNYLLYYNKAMCLRRMIKQSLNIEKSSVIKSNSDQKSHFSVLSRLCGLPSLTTPNDTFIANTGCEELLYGV